MSNKEKTNNSGDVVAWISNSLSGHAERQKTTLMEFYELGIKLDGEPFQEMVRAAQAWHRKGIDEWKVDQIRELQSERVRIESLSQRIVQPVRTASAIGRVSGDDVRVVKWRIVGDARVVYCIKHSSQTSPCTRGHTYVDIEEQKDLGIHCQRCVSELSNKKGHHQLRRLLERAGKLKRPDNRKGNDGSHRSNMSGKPVDMDTVLRFAGAAEVSTKVSTSETNAKLSSMSMAELRSIARSKGVEKMPRSKLELIQILESLEA